MSFQSSSNKLSLRQFVKSSQQEQFHIDRPSTQGDNPALVNKSSQQKQGSKPSSNDRRYSIKQGRKMKLSTLPCQQLSRQKQEPRQQFMFRSTWQGDIMCLKQQMKLKQCTSPTFATQCMSLSYNTKQSAGLFHAVNVNANSSIECQNQNNHNNNDQVQMRRSMNNNSSSQLLSDSKSLSRSRSKYKNKSSSIQKFIGDSVAKMYRNSHAISTKTAQHQHHSTQLQPNNDFLSDTSMIMMDGHEKMVYEMQKIQAKNQELVREKRRLEEKYRQVKEVNQRLEEEVRGKGVGQAVESSMMTNDELLQRMRMQPFWKFYLRAQKMIKSSLQQNPTSQPTSTSMVINFMKQLQALREVSSQMKKQHKVVKKLSQDRLQEIQQCKDKISVQQASIEEQRLRCVAYEGTIKKLREEVVGCKKEISRLEDTKLLEQKLANKAAQCTAHMKQLSLITQQLQQQKILNSQCQRQRLSLKKRTHQLTQQLTSLTKQLSSLKTSYNLLQIQKQQLSANQKQLIEKQKLKQRVYQLEKELKAVGVSKEVEMSRLKGDYERVLGKEVEVRESKCREMDQRVGRVIEECKELEERNGRLGQENQLLHDKLRLLQQENTKLNQQLITSTQHLNHQHHTKLTQLEQKLTSLNTQLQQQSLSLLAQQKMIKQLRQEIDQKEKMLKLAQSQSDNSKDNEQVGRMRELQEYVGKLQCKHNQALEMYEAVHNEKVEVEMRLQSCQQEVERCGQEVNRLQQLVQQLQQQLRQYRNHNVQQCQSQHTNNNPQRTQQILAIIQSILSVKQQIIRKILIFCPIQFRQLFVEYIYCGDVIKEKYLKVIEEDRIGNGDSRNNDDGEEGCYGEGEQGEEEDQQEQEQQSQYVQQQRGYYQRQPTTTHSNPTSMRTLPNTTYKPHYQHPHSRQYSYQTHLQQQPQQESSQPLNLNQLPNDNQISALMQEFMRIGSIIEEETSGNVGGYSSQYVSSGKRQVQGYNVYGGQVYSHGNIKVKSNMNGNHGLNKTQHNQMLQQQQVPRSQQSYLREANPKHHATTKQPLASYGQQNSFNTNNINNSRTNMKTTSYCMGKGEVRISKQKNVSKYQQQQQQMDYSNQYQQPQYTISRPLFSQSRQPALGKLGVNVNNNRNNFNNGVRSDK